MIELPKNLEDRIVTCAAETYMAQYQIERDSHVVTGVRVVSDETHMTSGLSNSSGDLYKKMAGLMNRSGILAVTDVRISETAAAIQNAASTSTMYGTAIIPLVNPNSS